MLQPMQFTSLNMTFHLSNSIIKQCKLQMMTMTGFKEMHTIAGQLEMEMHEMHSRGLELHLRCVAVK